MQEMCIRMLMDVSSVVRDCLINSYSLKIQVSMLLTSIPTSIPRLHSIKDRFHTAKAEMLVTGITC